MSLRDIVLATVMVAILPYVFRFAFIGILLWTWIGIMNPHKLAWGFMYDAPVATIAAIVVFVALFTTKDRVKLPATSSLVVLALFILWSCVTTASAFFVAESAIQLEKVLKIQLMVVVSAAVLYKFEHIRLFIWVNVMSLAFYGIKGGLYTIRTAGAGMVWGPPGGFISGNNELALALIMAIPLMYYLRITTQSSGMKRFLLLAMILCSISALGTQSRGGLVAIVAMGAVLWWRAPGKLINFLLISVLAVSLYAFMPQTWHDRMSTIQTYQDDGSAMGRIFAWQTAAAVANDRVTGAGYAMYEDSIFKKYAPYVSDTPFDSTTTRATHSIYFQVLGEHGYIGLVLFMLIWLLAWRTAGRLRRYPKDNPEVGWLYHLGGMAQVSLIGWLAGGTFLSLAYWDFPYNIVVMLIVAERWGKEQKTMPEVLPPVPPENLPRAGFRNRVLWWVRTV
jgi:putative inorganic carbon (HCO3(-)) transporter